MRELDEVWRDFVRGVDVTGEETLALYRQSKRAIQYLLDREGPVFHPAWIQAIEDHKSLERRLIGHGLLDPSKVWKYKGRKRTRKHEQSGTNGSSSGCG